MESLRVAIAGRFVLPILTSILTCIANAGVASTADGAIADENVAQGRPVLEEVVVTARKREESLLEISESVVAISGEDIERQNLKGLDDIGILIPNLNLSRRADGYPNVSIRGLGSFGNTQGVGFYLDDVQIFSDASSRFGDLERIEVLKGPQGTLYGGSNIGGAVKFVSARPDPEALFGRLKGQVGEQNLIDVEGSLNVPLGENDWALRLFAFSLDDDGYLDNPDPPRLNGVRGENDADVGKIEEYGARIMVAGPVTDRLSAFASLRYTDLDGPNNVWIRELDDSLDHPDVVPASVNPRHDRETTSGMLELTLAMDDWDVVSVTSYTDTDSHRTTDLDIREEFLLALDRPETMKVFTQELRVTSTREAPVQWIVGAYYSLFEETMRSHLIWHDVREDADGNFSGTLGCALGMPTCSGVWAGEPVTPEMEQDTVLTPFELRNRDKSHLAAFGNVTYSWTGWELGVGLRVDQWKNESENLDSGIASDQENTEFLPRLSLIRWLPGGSMAYGTFAMGYEPGGYNLANFEGENDLFGFGPEEATSYELGWKGRLMDGRLQATVAAFYLDYEDRQVEFQAESEGGVIEGIVNIGDSEHYGLEAEVNIQVNAALSVSVAAGWVDAEWKSGTVVQDQDLGGETPPGVQDFNWTLAADFRQPIAGRPGLGLLAGVQVTHSGEYEGLQAWDPVTNPDFTLVNAQVGIGTESWELMLNVKNLTDEEYYPDVQRFPNFFLLDGDESIVIGTLGQPRLISASFSYRF
jgi:iron complex outermembrane receptor protein